MKKSMKRTAKKSKAHYLAKKHGKAYRTLLKNRRIRYTKKSIAKGV